MDKGARMREVILLVLTGCSSSASPMGAVLDAGRSHDTGQAEASADAAKPADASKPGDASKPADAAKPIDAAKPTDAAKRESGADGQADTWTDYASGFVTKYCVECHGPSDPAGYDFTLYAKVYANRDVIRCGVSVTQDATWACAPSPSAQQFPISDGKTPPNPVPGDAERDRFIAWLSAGAPQ